MEDKSFHWTCKKNIDIIYLYIYMCVCETANNTTLILTSSITTFCSTTSVGPTILVTANRISDNDLVLLSVHDNNK